MAGDGPGGGTCPVEDCPSDARDGQLLCRRHWFLVPRDLRDDVWRTYKGLLAGEGSGPYREARDAAIAAAEQADAQ